MILEVYDLECLINIFTYTGYCPKTNTWHQFVICGWRNDYDALMEHLKRDQIIQVGFNNESYDYPLLHHVIRHYDEYKKLSGSMIAQKIYAKSQEIIEQQFSTIADKNKFIRQIDLYRIWHYNNDARRTSLKDLEICMRMENVEEMPIHHSTWCKQGDEICILEYNKNDVWATYLFLRTTLGKTDYSIYKGKNKIKLRENLGKKFKVNVMNMGDVPMGEELMLNLYSRKVGIPPYVLKKRGGTHRPNGINLKDCIPYWCKLESKEFNTFLDKLKTMKITGAKGEFAFSVIFHNYKFDFGLGGSHGCCNPRIWESNEDWVIVDYDVGSLYPSISKSLKLYPEHLGPVFNEQYIGFIDTRLIEKHKPKELRDNVLIEGYKLILNGTYGKSKEETSFLYDPLYTFKTTVAGQLFICMWAERWVKVCPELKFIQTNTDGQTIYIPRKDIDKIRAVNEQLTKETGLTIEEVIYKKMIVRDVNNYIGVYEDNEREHEHIKLKGDYEVDKEYHKDPSMRIVPLAVKNYFVYGVPVEETIRNHTDIFDFCMRLKTNSKSTPYFRHFDDNYNVVNDKLDRTTRYYISNRGGNLYKDFNGKQVGVNIGFSVTLFNKYVEKDMKDYDINYRFYIIEAKKLITSIETKQLSLFDLF